MSTFSDFLEKANTEGVNPKDADWQPSWIVRHLLARDCVNIIGGPQKIGKSLLRSHLIACALTGSKAVGAFESKQLANVLLLAGEERLEAEQARLRRALRGLGVARAVPITIIPPCGLRLDDKNIFSGLYSYVKESEVDLVVIDPLIRFHLQDENIAGQMTRMLTNIRILSTITTILLVHHVSKQHMAAEGITPGHRLRGTSDLAATYDQLVLIKPTQGENRRRRLLTFDSRYDDPQNRLSVEMWFKKDGSAYTFSIAERDSKTNVPLL